jgi:gluconolactonase
MRRAILNSAMDGFEILDARFAGMVLPNAPLQLLAEGFAWLEGPVWFADHEVLLFSDIPNDRIMRWTEAGVSVFRSPSHFSNGQTRDCQGRLITCSHRHRNITRTELDGGISVLADRFEGKRLNSPNDVVVKSDGSIWFTDPHYGINTDYEGGKQGAELPALVYRLDAGGALEIVADDFEGPNGLCFSPDERVLYICESGKQFAEAPRRFIRVFEVQGKSLGAGAEFHKVVPDFADGICCDEAGNIWSSAGDGVHCISPDGVLLGKILVPHAVSNLTFGGRNRSRLFICAGQFLYAIYTNTRGCALP